jgi:Tol biopolymer transport system component
LVRGQLAATAIVALACIPTATAVPQVAASVSFVRNYGIFRVATDGTGVSLVSAPGVSRISYSDPAWSRDGGRLAFTIYSEQPSNYLQVALTQGQEWRTQQDSVQRAWYARAGKTGLNGMPSWAPDKRRIVLVSYKRPGGSNIPTAGELFIAQPGRRSRPVEADRVRGALDTEPAWSPDGRRIAFARNAGAGFNLYLIRPDGTGLKRLTKTPAHNPSWSPDGKRIVFDDGRDIFTIGADAKNLRRLTRSTARADDPAWSPDRRLIVFVRGRSLWLMTAAGRGTRRIAVNAAQPAWIPG